MKKQIGIHFLICVLVCLGLLIIPVVAGEDHGDSFPFKIRMIPDPGIPFGQPCSTSAPARNSLQWICSECFEMSKCLIPGFLCYTTDTGLACMNCEIFCLPCTPA